jgi:hypothetical protein
MKKTIKAIWGRFSAWMRRNFSEPQKLIADTRAIVAALRLIRAAINSPAALELVKTIPGQVDNAILDAIKHGVDKLLNISDAWEDLPDILEGEAEEAKNAFIHKVGSTAVRQLHPRIKEAQADHMVQHEYMAQKFNS